MECSSVCAFVIVHQLRERDEGGWGLVFIDPITLRSSYFLLLLIPLLCFLITHGWLYGKTQHAKEKPLEKFDI